MLSHEVLSVLDSLSPDKASQTDERQAMLLGFEAMRGELFIIYHRILENFTQRVNLKVFKIHIKVTNNYYKSDSTLCIRMTHCSSWLLVTVIMTISMS